LLVAQFKEALLSAEMADISLRPKLKYESISTYSDGTCAAFATIARRIACLTRTNNQEQ
jgi:hypothetical protein